MEDTPRRSAWLGRLAVIFGVIVALCAGGAFLIGRADGPVFVFAGGPLRSGEMVELSAIDWDRLDARPELELEITGAGSSRTLWFSVYEGAPYVACDLDCIGGLLNRWPQQIERDNRVVIRIDGTRAEGQLIHVPHESAEYVNVRAGREQKYSGGDGGRAAAEAAAHGAVIDVGEVLTGRSERDEPGDRLYRVDPR